MRSRVLLFGGLTAACIVLAGGYVAYAALLRDVEPTGAHAAVAAASSPEEEAQARRELRTALASPKPRVLFLDWDRDHPKRWGAVALAPLAEPAGRRAVTALRCERVYLAAGRGLCLARTGRLKISFVARVFATDGTPWRSVPIKGIPSRARVSADGRYGAVTTFVSGHSYADPGTFSTRTAIIDLTRGRELTELERFAITKGGESFDRADFNFWGVTFVPGSSRFYATLASGEKTYLIAGDLRTRRARVLRENVECPSLSPDGTRLAFKKVVFDPARQWRFHVLDLRTMAETPLAETRSLDDQIEWLDDGRVLYQVDEQVWTVPADGSGAPRLYLPKASSPVVLQ